MLQRKQTVYLFFAIVCFIVCAVLPLGRIVSADMGVSSTVNSLGLVDGQSGKLSYPYYALPVFFLALNAFQSLAIIFMYKNRKMQALNCYVQIVGIVVEAIVSGALIYFGCIEGTENSFHAGFGLSLPIIAMIFLLLAHKGIMDDERLIRSVDRIR